VTIEGRSGWYLVSLAAAGAVVLVTHLVVGSRFGRALVATRDNEQLALAAGIDVFRTRLFAFSLSGAFAGLAGALYAHFITYIDPGVFGFSVSETLLIMVILGGSGTLWGPVGGAVVFAALPELLRIAERARSSGVILLLIVLYRPAGMAVAQSASHRGAVPRHEPDPPRPGHRQGVSGVTALDGITFDVAGGSITG
jgi:branched-chain amino acid transport system permease protein